MEEKELQAKMAEARAQGYTDEQIQAFLNPQPVERLDQKQDESGGPISPFVDRGEEAIGTAQYAAADTAYNIAKYGTIGGGGYYGAKKIAQALRGPAAGTVTTPTVSTAPTVGPQLPGANTAEGIKQIVKGGPVQPGTNPYTPTASVAAPGQSLASQIGAKFAPIAQRVSPILQGANKLLAPAAMASELFYTSPEQRAQLQEMERTGTTLKDYTKQKLGMTPPVQNSQAQIDEMIRKAAAKKALAFPNQ